MDIEQAVVSLIKSDTSIKALIKTRIRPIAAAEFDIRPYVGFYSQIPEEQFDHFKGVAETRRVEFTFDIFGDTLGQCKAVSKAFRGLLHYLNAETIEDIEIRLSKHTGDTDLSEPPSVGQANPIKHISSTYLILYREVTE